MTTQAVGDRRLLKLADILDKADALHRKRKEPTYKQTDTFHACGTPACAMGHWAVANPRRFVINEHGMILLRGHIGIGLEPVEKDFALSHEDANDIFAAWGCDGAKTAKQAAKYIRRFVAKRRAK